MKPQLVRSHSRKEPTALLSILSGETPDRLPGRDSEIAAISQVITDASDGHGGAALVEGEPGIGKSRFLTEIAAAALKAGYVVMHGTADETKTSPWAPWDSTLESFCRGRRRKELEAELGDSARAIATFSLAVGSRLMIVPEPHDEGSIRRARADLEDWLIRLAADKDVLILIDNIHLHGGSVDLFNHLAMLPLGRVCLIASSRTNEDVVGDLDVSISRVGLRPLSPDVLRTLVDNDVSEGDVRKFHERTGGNPFMIHSYLRLTSSDPGSLAQVLESVPDVIRRYVDGYVSRYTDLARRVVGLASVMAQPFKEPMLLGVGVSEMLDALDELSRKGVISRVANQAWSFRHSLVQEAIYASLDEDTRRRYHLEAANKLRSVQGKQVGASELARHLLEARPISDRGDAADAACAAGDESLSRLDFMGAKRWYEAAVDELDGLEPPRLGIRALRGLGSALWSLFDQSAKEPLARATALAIRSQIPDAAYSCLLDLSKIWTVFGSTDYGLLALLDEALLFYRQPSIEHSVLSAMKARVAYWDDLDDSRLQSLEALEEAETLGDLPALIRCLTDRHESLHGPDSIDERLRLALRTKQLARSVGDREAELLAMHRQAVDLLELGRFEEAYSVVDESDVLALQLQLPAFLFASRSFRIIFHLMRGEYAQVSKLLEEHRSGVESLEAGPTAFLTLMAQQFVLLRDTGEHALSPLVRPLVSEYSSIDTWRAALALLLVDEGDLEGGLREATDLLESLDGRRRDVGWLATVTMLAEVVALARDEGACRSLLQLLEPFRERWILIGWPAVLFGSVIHRIALLQAALHDSNAQATFEAAKTSYRTAGAYPWLARLHVAWADLVQGRRTTLLRAARGAIARCDPGMPTLSKILATDPIVREMHEAKRLVLEDYVEGKSVAAIARDRRVDRSSVNRYLRQARQALGIEAAPRYSLEEFIRRLRKLGLSIQDLC